MLNSTGERNAFHRPVHHLLVRRLGDAEHAAYPALGGHAPEGVGGLHRGFLVGDEHKLGARARERLDKGAEAADVGLV